jgi:hypothetical protein
MLQRLSMGIKGYHIDDISVIVMLNTHVQRGDLPKISYIDAEERAAQTVALFQEDLKIDSSKITICKNYSKEQMLTLLGKLQDESDQFQKNLENDSHSIKTIIISYIGFRIVEQTHPYVRTWRG